MTRPSTILLGTGICLIAVLAALWLLGLHVRPGFLTAWLFILSVPAGALPILLALELAGHGDGTHADALRRVLAALPLGVLLALPVLIGVHGFYRWAQTPHEAAWLTPVFFDMRSIFYLLVWVVVALLVRRPVIGAPRIGFCLVGFIAYALAATLAADDWIGTAEPGPDIASLGLLLITSQVVIAAAAARLLGAPASPIMALAGLFWGFVAFTRFLTVWSADKPAEIIYYQHRQTVFGQGVVWLSFTVVAFSLLTLLPGPLRRLSVTTAVLVLLAHGADFLWMVTPAERGLFTFTVPDVVAMLAVAALGAGSIALLAPAKQTA